MRTPYDPFVYARRKTYETDKIGNHHVPVVFSSLDAEKSQSLRHLIRYATATLRNWINGNVDASDFVSLGSRDLPYSLPEH